MTDYLRNRPFLCVEITYRAANHINTSKKGWQLQEGAMRAYDRVVILDRVNRAEKFHIIIDIINSTVVKNSTKLDETQIRAEYMSRYKDDIKQAITIWAMNEASARKADEIIAEVMPEAATEIATEIATEE